MSHRMHHFVGHHLFWVIAAVIVVGLAAVGMSGSQRTEETADTGKLKVAATIFPIADIASQIAGDQADVIDIMPPGSSPHTFDPRPSDISRLQGARAVFMVGYGLDSWMDNLANSLPGARLVTVDHGISLKKFVGAENGQEDEHGGEADHEDGHVAEADYEGTEDGGYGHDHIGIDPHYWLSPANAKQIAQNIADQLAVLDSANADYYRNRLQEYQQALADMDADIKERLAPLAGQELLVFHDSWRYFADHYDLEIAGVFQPSPGKEPTPHYLKALYAAAREHQVSAVFTEPQLGTAALEPFMDDLGLEMHTLDPLGGVAGRDSYQRLIRYNADQILAAYGK